MKKSNINVDGVLPDSKPSRNGTITSNRNILTSGRNKGIPCIDYLIIPQEEKSAQNVGSKSNTMISKDDGTVQTAMMNLCILEKISGTRKNKG